MVREVSCTKVGKEDRYETCPKPVLGTVMGLRGVRPRTGATAGRRWPAPTKSSSRDASLRSSHC